MLTIVGKNGAMECNCHIFPKYLVFQNDKVFDQNTRYFELEILKY